MFNFYFALGAATPLLAIANSQNTEELLPELSLLPTAYSNVSATKWHSMPSCNGIIIEDATINDLQTYMTEGNLSSVELTICYMQRVFQTNPYIK